MSRATFLMTQERRVHVAIGPSCNNNCIFCMEEDREARRQQNSALTAANVRQILETNRWAQEVCFTSGEPTLVPALPLYIGWARDLKYPRVSISTNGRRLAYADYCAELITAGASLFYVSLHGHTARLHDGLVRAPGAFEQTTRGLRNLQRQRSHRTGAHLLVQACTVITRRNLPHLTDIYRFARSLGVDQVVFNAAQVNGRAHTHFDRVCPHYDDIAASFVALLRETEGTEEQRPPVFLIDVPPCATEQLPDHHRGWVEQYVHHEVDNTALDAAGTRLVERHRADLDANRRAKREPCACCVHDSVCPGVWTNYLARHGWADLQPQPSNGASGPLAHYSTGMPRSSSQTAPMRNARSNTA